jgi:ketosteroid isomerase-like protein
MTGSHDTPTALVERFVAAFNDGDLDALERLYLDDAVVVPVPGQVTEDRRGALAYLLSLKAAMSASVRRCLTVGDTALLVVDWTIGELAGTAADVVRFDGSRWRYVIDNPHGTA